MANRRSHQFDIDLPEFGSSTKVLLDGNDISGMLRGIEVSSSVTRATRITLKPARGQRAKLRVMLPEALITIDPEVEQTRARRLRIRR